MKYEKHVMAIDKYAFFNAFPDFFDVFSWPKIELSYTMSIFEYIYSKVKYHDRLVKINFAVHFFKPNIFL